MIQEAYPFKVTVNTERWKSFTKDKEYPVYNLIESMGQEKFLMIDDNSKFVWVPCGHVFYSGVFDHKANIYKATVEGLETSIDDFKSEIRLLVPEEAVCDPEAPTIDHKVDALAENMVKMATTISDLKADNLRLSNELRTLREEKKKGETQKPLVRKKANTKGRAK